MHGPTTLLSHFYVILPNLLTCPLYKTHTCLACNQLCHQVKQHFCCVCAICCPQRCYRHTAGFNAGFVSTPAFTETNTQSCHRLQVVTPAGGTQTKPAETSQSGAASTAASVSPSVAQQPQIIGVRTLLEFVAWLVCTSLPDGSATSVKAKTRSDEVQSGFNSRRGAVFLTEELSAVGIAVRRMQVGSSL